MPASIDPAILRALSIDTSTASIKTHGGSGFASTYHISTPTTSFFVKTSSSTGAQAMFEGEHASLNAIHNAVPSLCPKSFAHGRLDKGGYFLATDFLDLGGRSRGKSGGGGDAGGTGISLAQKLAKLHSTPAPIPDGYEKPMFGFPVTTCCGDTPQDNTFTESWSEFFGQRRLIAILERCEKNNGKDAELRRTVERTVKEVVPRLLADGHLGGDEGIVPVVVHGDLWAGNHGTAGGEEVVFDPSASYSHSEFEGGIQRMFGGFGTAFWKEYHAILPKTKPIEEYDDRVSLYEAYHHLNHNAIFGGGYKSGAMSILKGLLKKYGEK